MVTKQTTGSSAPQPHESVHSLFKLADVALSAAESFAALNMETARQALSEGAKNSTTLLAIKTPQDATAAQAALAKPGADTAKKYSEKVYQISSDAAKELATVFQEQFEHMNKSFRELAEKSGQSFPMGSAAGTGSNPFNQVFDAANKAFENIKEVRRSFQDYSRRLHQPTS